MVHLPTSQELTAVFDAVITRWHDRGDVVTNWVQAERDADGPENGEGLRLAHRLALINTFQWHEEDRSRDLGADDTVLAEVKRSIDASNRRRVQTIDALDHWYVSALDEAGLQSPEAALTTEGVGSVVDRLSILALKLYHVREACDAAAAEDREALATRLSPLEEQFQDLARWLDHLPGEIAAGRLRLKLYRQVKVYRDAATGRLRADV
jgi:hypothetical protein